MNNNPTTIALDADHMGTLLVLMSELHTYWVELWREGKATPEDTMEKLYLMGNMEGRCLYNGLIMDDLDLLEAWEEEMEAWKEAHGGFLLPIDEVVKEAMDAFHNIDKEPPEKHKISLKITDTFCNMPLEVDMAPQEYETLQAWLEDSESVIIMEARIN